MATLRTVTVKPSGGDYASLNAAFVGESGDLVALDRQLTIIPYAMQDGSADTGSGYTTDAAHPVEVIVPADERHTGVWDDTKYRMISTNKDTLSIQIAHLRVSGLQLSQGYPGGTQYRHCVVAPSVAVQVDQQISECILRTVTACHGATLSSGNAGTVRVSNCVVYDASGGSTRNGLTSAPSNFDVGFEFYNNTVVGFGGVGINQGAGTSPTCRNNLIAGCALPFKSPSGFNLSRMSNNATDAADLGYAAQAGDRVGQTFTFVDVANKNYQLTSTDAGAKGYGADLSAQFTKDIAGNTRTTPWDIGAFMAAAGTPGGPTTGTGNITGYAEVAGVGSAMWVATAAAAASSTAAAVGARVAVAVATSAGVSTSTVVGAAVRPSVAASAGSATVAAVGAAPAVAVAASVSSSTAAAIGAAVAVGVGSSAGAATAAATSTSVVPTIVSAVGASASTSTAPAVGAALWSSIGQCLALAASAVVGVALAATVAVSVGRATAPGVGRATAVAVAASAGSAGVLGRSSAGLIQPATGAAIGSATVSATGAAVAVSRATSDGIAAAPGAGVAVAVTRGVAVGQGAATGTAVSTIAATGTAIATSTALGCAAAVAVAAGSSAGSSTAAGTALPPVAHMRVALTSCGPSADFTSTGPTVALASRGPSVEFGIPFAAEE